MVISSLLFGVLHLLNPRASWIVALCIAVEAGIAAGGGLRHGQQAWYPIGLHFAWNITQGGIFGVAVSGIAVHGLLKATVTGPELVSGGEFGAEGSIFAVLTCTSMAIVLIVFAIRKGQIIRPFWRRARGEKITVIDQEQIPPPEESIGADRDRVNHHAQDARYQKNDHDESNE